MGFHDSQGVYHAYNGIINISLHELREVDANGAVSNIAGNGGLLASDTTPIMRNTSGKVAQELSWAASNSDAVLCQKDLPQDFDGRFDCMLEMWVNSGTTDPGSFTALTSWDGGANVSTTVTDGAKSATYHKITAIIPNGSIPDVASYVSIHLTPAAHTTNALQLQALRLLYVPKTV